MLFIGINTSYGPLSTYLMLCRVPNILLDHSGLDLVASEGIWSNMDLNMTVLYVLSHKRSCSGLGRTVWSLYSAHSISGCFCLPGLLSFAWDFCPQDCFIVATIAPAIASVFWRIKKKRERQEKHTSLSLPPPAICKPCESDPEYCLAKLSHLHVSLFCFLPHMQGWGKAQAFHVRQWQKNKK